MDNQDSSVTMYAHGTLVYQVHFPHGKADCRHCPYSYYSEPYKLFRCTFTRAYMEYAEMNQRHWECPIQLDDVPF